VTRSKKEKNMSCNQFDFRHLILLIGTNPLPNFVVADYFLQHNENLRKIWLIYSKTVKSFQAGTRSQAKNLEKLLQKKWEGKRKLQFPFETFIELSDVSNAAQIKRDIPDEMIKELKNSEGFHLNYTGGTKAMSTHVYRILEQVKNKEEKAFSYLDARKFRLIDDDKDEEIADDLRREVTITFDELFDLHGFNERKQKTDTKQNSEQKLQEFKSDIENGRIKGGLEGWIFEDYIYEILDQNIKSKLNNNQPMLQNQLIKKSGWEKNFELDVILLHGYQLTGISCSLQKEELKLKGFEIIHRIRQIGGDEAKSVLITALKSRDTENLQNELLHDTGGDKNILVLGIDDLKKERLVSEIEKFIFEKE
jgi:hypothetical protein